MFRVFNSTKFFTRHAPLFLLVLAFHSKAYAFDRIVILTPGLAEWTAEILGETKSRKQVIAVSEYSYYPEHLKKLPTIGPYPQVSVEKIAALEPDLILASLEYNRPEQIEQLKRLKLPVTLIPAEKFNAMGEWIAELGKALHEEKEAKRAEGEWTRLLEVIKTHRKEKSQRLFIEIQHQPLVTVGKPSFLTDAFSLLGYTNVFQKLEQGYPKVSKEAVLKENPDAIFILDLSGVKEDFEKARLDWLRLKTLKAVQANQIRTLPGDDFARCSLRLLKALNELH